MSEWKAKCRCGQPLDFAAYDIESGRPQEGSDYWCSDGDPQTGPHDQGVIVDNGLEQAIAKAAERNDCQQCGAPMLGRKCLRCGWVAASGSLVSTSGQVGGAPLPFYDDYYVPKGAFQGSGTSLTIPNISIGQGNTLYLAVTQTDSDGLAPFATITWNGQSVPGDPGEATIVGASLIPLRGFFLPNVTAGTGSIVITGGGPSVVGLGTCVCELKNVRAVPLDTSEETGQISNSASTSLGTTATTTDVLVATAARMSIELPPDAAWANSETMKQSILSTAIGVDGTGVKLYQGVKMVFPGRNTANVSFGHTNGSIGMILATFKIK